MHEHRPRPSEPRPTLDEDLSRPATGHARLRRNYLALVGPVLLIAAVAAFGAFGRRSAPPDPSSPPSLEAAVPSGSGVVLPAPSQRIAFAPVDMGSDLTGTHIAAAGRRIFYTVGAKTLVSLSLAPGAARVPLVTVGQCEGISAVAATGLTLLYVVAASTMPAADSTCGEPTRIGWTIWAMNLVTGQRRQLAHGERVDGPETRAFPPVHVAVSQDAYAFERPAPALAGSTGSQALPAETTEVVEVHSLADDRLRWQTTVPGPISLLELGGSRLAIQTDVPERRLFVADAAHPQPAFVARPSSGSGLSPDGRYLSWDGPEPSAGIGTLAILLRDLDTGHDRILGVDSATPGPDAVQPVVGATGLGPEVAWFDLLADGGTAPAFVDATHPSGGRLATVQEPVWMSIQGDDLVWVVALKNADRALAFVADLPTAPAESGPFR